MESKSTARISVRKKNDCTKKYLYMMKPGRSHGKAKTICVMDAMISAKKQVHLKITIRIFTENSITRDHKNLVFTARHDIAN